MYLWNDLHHNIHGGSWSITDFSDLCIPCFEEILMWVFMGSVNFLSWVHDGFMWMADEIFRAMFEIKEGRFYWGIHVSTDSHGDIL